jgi:hypothetical protein
MTAHDAPTVSHRCRRRLKAPNAEFSCPAESLMAKPPTDPPTAPTRAGDAP